jgi:RNA polymerase sigma-70 factor (ECF subfamily)
MLTNVNRNVTKFEKIALVHTDIIYSAALKLTKSRMEAEDLTQETFLRAYRFFDKFKEGTNCKAWLFKIMTNLFINKYNKAKSQPDMVNFDDVGDYYLDDKIKADDYIENSEYLPKWIFDNLFDDDIRKALLELPEEFRLVIVLCDVQGFSYLEIAEMTGSKIGTVKSRLFRARQRLQKSLWEWAVNNGYIGAKIQHGAA